MSKVSDAVKEIVSSNPYIQNVLGINLLSVSRYANVIHKDVEKIVGHTVQTNAIVMALRRYGKVLESTQPQKEKANYKIEVRTNIYNVNVNIKEQNNIINFLNSNKSDFINFSLSNNEITISIDENNRDVLNSMISNKNILSSTDDLAALTLVFDDTFLLTYGIIFEIVRKLALNRININEIYSTIHELTFVVKREDSMKAYGLLQELIL